MQQLDMFRALATDDEIRAWAKRVGWDCPTRGDIPPSIREAHADNRRPDPMAWIPDDLTCTSCGRTERTVTLYTINHPRRAEGVECISRTLRRNHLRVAARNWANRTETWTIERFREYVDRAREVQISSAEVMVICAEHGLNVDGTAA